VTRVWPEKKPDVDNFVKSFLDAWEKSGLLANDSLIIRVDADKIYAEKGGFGCVRFSYCPMEEGQFPEQPRWTWS